MGIQRSDPLGKIVLRAEVILVDLLEQRVQ
jgi:hypothetical protein